MPVPPQSAFASPWPGLSFARLPGSGIAVVSIHYSARPDMTPERAAKERAQYPSEAAWQQEMEMDAHAKSGQLVYPEFDEQIHVVPDEWAKLAGPLCRYMAIDPHLRTPHSFLWVGIDRCDDWWVYREIWPSKAYGTKSLKDNDAENQFQVRDYAMALAQVEGNEIVWSDAEKAADERGMYVEKSGGEKIIYRYMDQAGKGFRATDESQPLESFSDRYDRYGIRCRDPYKSHGFGEDAVRSLLEPRENNLFDRPWPQLHIAASCRELIWEFKNFRYQTTKTPTNERELKQMPIQARSHMLDLLRYLAASGGCRWMEELAS